STCCSQLPEELVYCKQNPSSTCRHHHCAKPTWPCQQHHISALNNDTAACSPPNGSCSWFVGPSTAVDFLSPNQTNVTASSLYMPPVFISTLGIPESQVAQV
ncbi:hypothetical protein GGH92_010248, partial [Coemansia sp. RSA 2673]